MAEPDASQDFDSVFGPEEETKPRDFDQVFGPEKSDLPNFIPGIPIPGLRPFNPAVDKAMPWSLSADDWKEYLNSSPGGRIISAFGSAFTGPGIGDEATKWMREAGIYSNVAEEDQANTDGFAQGVVRPATNALRAFNQGLLTTPTAVADAAFRAAEGGLKMAEQIGIEMGVPKLGRDVAGIGEMYMTWGGVVPGGVPHIPRPIEALPTEAERMAAVRAMTINPIPKTEFATSAEAIAAEGVGRQRLSFLDAEDAAGKPLSDYQIAERDWLRTDPHGDDILRVYPFLKDQIQATLTPRLPEPIAAARANGIIGEGEAGYFGTKPPTEADLAARAQAAGDMVPTPIIPQDAFLARAAEAAPEVPPDIHQVARNVAPVVMKEWDALNSRQESYRRWLDELAETRAASPKIAEAQGRVDEILGKVNGVEDRLTKAASARLETARSELHDLMTTDTPDMVTVRKALQETDLRRRDMAADVSAAYREAEDLMPPVAENGQISEMVAEPTLLEKAEPQVGTAEAAASVPDGLEPAAPGGPSPPGVPSHVDDLRAIASDVSTKMQAAGRSAEESDAAAQIVAAYYETRAQRMGGKLGSARELYEQDGAHIAPTRDKASAAASTPELEMAQELEQSKRGGVSHSERGKSILDEGRKVIRMMATSDASTFLHETSHPWLGDLLRDAAHPDAPASLKADAAAVLEWLGAENIEALKATGKGGKLTKVARAANEKWARGFERYLMEGRAPTKALASVFAKFKTWLTEIYQTVKKLRSPINDDIRDVFDRLLTKPPERTVIADDMATAHEHLADVTSAEDALGVARGIRGERTNEIVTKYPELANELGIGRSAAAGEALDGGADAAGSVGEGPGGVSGAGAVGAGRGAPAAEGVGPARPKYGPNPKQKLYVTPPRRPPSLADWVKARGGIKASDFDKVIGVERKSKPGIVPKEGGNSADDLAVAAWSPENGGFFPENSERPSEREFLAKLGEDLRGNYQWAEADHRDVADYKAALDHNSEVDRIANELSIETKGLSHAEFWDQVAERMSLEDRAKAIDEQAAHHETALADADAEADAFLEGHGEPVEPPVSRTLEELENERRQEEASRGQIAGAANDEPSDATGQHPPEVQDGAGSRGRGTEPAGRAEPAGGADGVGSLADSGPDAGKPLKPKNSGDANERFPSADPELIDKAGNIRLENLNSVEDVNQVLRDMAAQNDQFIGARRGVVTDAEVLDFADAMGIAGEELNLEKLRAMSVEDAVPLASRIVAGRKLLVQSAREVRAAMAKAAVGTDADLMAYAAARDKHMRIQETLSGITAEWGRAGRAFRRLAGDTGAADADMLTELFQSATGRTPKELRKEAQMGMAFDKPEQISKYLNDAKKPTFWEKIIEFRQAAMLWSPKSWGRNLYGGVLTLVADIPTHTVAAGIGKIRNIMTGSEERIYMAETGSRLFGAIQGARNGLKVAGSILKDETYLDRARSRAEVGFDIGQDAQRKEHPRHAIGGKTGEVVRGSFRIMSATDAVFKGIAYEMKLNELAARQAIKEGYVGEKLTSRVTVLTQSPTEELMAAAKKFSEYQTFNNELNGFLKDLQMLSIKRPGVKLVIPFMRTPVNILKYSAERSVLAPFVKEARENLMGKNGAIARDEAIARIAVGSAISLAAWSLAAQGTITGGGPKNPAHRATLMATGWKPYSLNVGEHWISYAGFEPISTLLGVAADVQEVGHAMTDPELKDVGGMMIASITNNFINKTYMSGLSDFFTAVNDPVRYGDNYLLRTLGSFVPSGVAGIGQSTDPYMREVRTMLDGARDRVGLAQDLFAKRDIYGEPIRRSESLGPDFASPIGISKIVDDPVTKELLNLDVFPSKVSDKIRGVELTPEQYDQYAMVAGRKLKQRLDGLVKQEGWGAMPAHQRRKIMQGAIEHSRDAAASLVITQSHGTSNDILVKARQNKRDLAQRIDTR